ncbi:hypothetical protein L0Y65_03445 [Candidatus Micrarchaeota archaeon]|nr:hypothetical protein [Candidatus Micrarchaeota archaeon]
MGKALTVLVILLALFAAGCLQPVVKLGCCLKENLSQGCVLYNTTDFTNKSYIGQTNGPCNSSDAAYNTSGHCNVTIDLGGATGERTFLIPLCTQDDIKPCISQNCTTMVCGEFSYKPRFAPGFQTSGSDTSNPDSSVEASSGNIPPDTGEGGASQFYNAQCRFLPMDAKLRQVMKSSSSTINVFRIGVGGSMDEFDQYKYYLPLSDKYCNINSGSGEAGLIDRYMNYLTGSKTEYNPNARITQNCLNDAAGAFGTPNPFGFAEGTAPKSSYISVGFTFNPVVPDATNYKFAHHAREDWAANYDKMHGFYFYGGASVNQDDVFKRIDEEYYRRELSIAHASTMYGLDGSSTTRAPFECDSRGNECYSGACNTQFYSRTVLLTVPGISGGFEVVADCARTSDENGKTKVVCAPTKSVTAGSGGQPPSFTYATVTAKPQHVEVNEGYNHPFGYGSVTGDNEDSLDAFWDGFNSGQFYTKYTGSARTLTNTASWTSSYYTYRKYCTHDYGEPTEDNQDEWVLCSYVSESAYRPPAGGIVFFGKTGDNDVVYNGNKIIGYAIATPSDFKNMLFVKNCGINTTQKFPVKGDYPPEDEFGCWNACRNLCPGMDTSCSNWCALDDPNPASQPCTPASTDARETADYVRVDLDNIDDPDWDSLMAAFRPYFKERLKSMTNGGFDDGCGSEIQPQDVVISSMPWVLNYNKGLYESSFTGSDYFESMSYHMSGSGPQVLRRNNVFSERMETSAGTSSCDLRRTVIWWWMPTDLTFSYDLLFSQHIYLFKYRDGTGALGNCAIDESDYMPVTRTYGWCEPCTTSTLAFQSITAEPRVYMPAYTANVENTTPANLESVCTATYDTSFEFWSGFTVTDNVSCVNSRITDVGDYKESIGGIGSPRTSPEATILKERMGNYMKSGILPVIDMTDASNWNIRNPDSDLEGFWLFYESAPENFSQYDFQRLFGEMGAVVVIVNHISGDATDVQIEEIIDRSSIIHERCFGCLTAFHVDSPPSNESFRDSLNSVLSDSRAAFAVDMVTFDYPVSSHSSVFSGLAQAENRSDAIADDIASFGRVALQSRGKPSMLVGLNVRSNDGYWNDANYKVLFEKIVRKQDEMVKFGLIGIIYAPARAASGTDTGIVSVDSSGLGHKGEKFCAMQSAMQTMTTGAPLAFFSRVNSVDSMNCTRCSSLDRVGTGVCSAYSVNTLHRDPKMCDNGALCSVPDGMPEDEARCPDGIVIDSGAGECTLCNETGKMYTCTLKYSNGTVQTVGPRPMDEVGSDIFLDVIAGIPKPDKCCLVAPNNNRSYTYVKDAYQNSINKPIVFSKSGDPDMECNLGDPKTVSEIGTFCGIDLPLRDYDINCTLSG